jgi:NAD(P)-dependent dehydrogenase (short-subunit alcohol dehydrogenase family)
VDVPSFDLSGKCAVVTGGGSGIGLAIVSALATAGASVAIWGRNVEKARTAADEIDGRVVAVRCDVSDEREVVSAVAATVDALGQLDVCVANAGVPGNNTRFVDTGFDEFRRVTATDLDGVFLTFRETART